MKKLNSFLFSIFMMLVCILPFQSSFAVDVPLKKGDPGSVGGNAMINRLFSLSSAFLPVTASLDYGELDLNFSDPVGIVHISVVDQNGSVVYSEIIDTDSTLETIIETTGWDNGDYTLKVVYGSTSLYGDFQL